MAGFHDQWHWVSVGINNKKQCKLGHLSAYFANFSGNNALNIS